ncbi:response regulator transcription factor [Kribbella catacumbae]|uniref:response regulator transcription factor n=1 Tax=Kribbella catacumbae TaxID=460086 RepID=UPI00035F672D|nr:response regulator transcription factor [Kribbella catacumbae]
MGTSATALKPQLLVVDDDHKLVPLLERGLRYEGFGVICAYSGAEALAAIRHHLPDLVLLDVGMPELDGFDVLRELRRRTDVPVVMLTAKDEVSDKVGALDLGADDYVAKPFDFDELVARIRAVLRRRGADALDRFSHDDLVCDLGTREVVRGGRRIELTVTEFDLLGFLLRNPRRIHSREALLRAIWGYDVPVDSNVVDVHIGHLRRKLGEPPLIQTVRGVGYALRSEP